VESSGFDELFTEDDEVVVRASGRRPWLLRAVLPAFAVTAVAYTLSHAIGVAPPLLLLLAMVLGAFLIREAAASGREPGWRRARDVVRPLSPNVASQLEPPDGVLAAVSVWDRRLERASAAPRHAAVLLMTHLGDVADERVRQRYGVTRATDPARVRAVLGEGTTAVLGGTGRPPTDAELNAVVSRLEAL
jgi:hypothetical protein